jgi:hypothetical protein
MSLRKDKSLRKKHKERKAHEHSQRQLKKRRVKDLQDARELIADCRAKYLGDWTKTSAHFETIGAYDWMASKVEGYRRILEIGIGDGASTLCLVTRGHVAVGVDEIPHCVDRSADRLRAAGVDVLKFDRERLEISGPRSYSIEYGKPKIAKIPEKGAVLLTGDVIRDDTLRMAARGWAL